MEQLVRSVETVVRGSSWRPREGLFAVTAPGRTGRDPCSLPRAPSRPLPSAPASAACCCSCSRAGAARELIRCAHTESSICVLCGPSLGGWLGPLPWILCPVGWAAGLARISHQLSAAAGDASHPAVLSPLGVLNVLLSTSPRPSSRKPHWARHLAALATKPGEICGLEQLEDFDVALALADQDRFVPRQVDDGRWNVQQDTAVDDHFHVVTERFLDLLGVVDKYLLRIADG